MIYYDKLVRDRIPEIIRGRGAQCSVRSLDPDEFTQGLVDKLSEELDEYLHSRNLEELADLLEVIYTLAEHRGVSVGELEQMRVKKQRLKGGFEEKFLLEWVKE